MQTTSFPYEILIHDDASSDNTVSIIEEYRIRFPEMIYPIYQSENQFSLGVRGINLKYNLPRAKGKYIAICEGDDYWTDPLKLQKQVNFLEANAEFILTCGGFSQKLNGITKEIIKNSVFSADKEDDAGFKFTLDDLVERWITKTLTCVFRNSKKALSEMPKYKHTRDVHMVYHILKHGHGYYFKQIFGVYNIHDGGVFSLTTEASRLRTHYDIYKELYIVNRDEFTRKMYFKHLLRIINFRLSSLPNSHRCGIGTIKAANQAIKLIRHRRDFVALVKAFVPRKIKSALNAVSGVGAKEANK